jgi:hypothetical protein
MIHGDEKNQIKSNLLFKINTEFNDTQKSIKYCECRNMTNLMALKNTHVCKFNIA